MARKATKTRTARRTATPAATRGAAPGAPKALEPAPPAPLEAQAAVAVEDLDPLQYIKEFDSQLDVLLDVKQSLETDLAETRTQVAQARRTNEEMMQQLHELEAEVQRQASVRNELDFLHGEATKAGEQLKQSRELLEEKNTTGAHKDERTDKLQAAEQEMRDEIAGLKEQQTQIRSERAESDSHLQVAKLERNEMMLEIRKLEEAFAKDEERALAAESELEQARTALSKLHGSFEVSKRKAERILKK